MRTLAALALLLAAHAATAAPAAGTNDARLCVTVASQEPTCGPAQARLAGMDVDFSGGNHNGSRFVELVQVAQGGRLIR